MKKSIILLVFVCFADLFLGSSIFGQTPPPTPNPQYLYYCLNETATPLSAIPSGGGTLRWYTAVTGGTFSIAAPTPSTATAATGGSPITYYVTQIVSGVESTPRTPIYVYVNQQLDLYCQTVTPNSIKFDFANTGQSSFTYSYTIDGGLPITGTHNAPSNFTVAGLNEKQTVVFTLTAIGAKPCVTSQTESCTTICSPTSIGTPNFPAIAPFCSGTVAPILGTTSPNNITGTWNPAVINNTTSGNYVFTPDPVLFPCALTQTLNVTVTPLTTPTFTGIPITVCQNATAPILPTNSNNSPAITGTWSPAVVNTAMLGSTTYTFTPNAGQCTSLTLSKVTINIVPVVTPNFANIPPFCFGSTAPLLTNTSPNGIVGTWSPVNINNVANGTYVFTPNANQCATTQTLNVVVIPKTTPNFAAIPAFCTGSTAPLLATTSPNGISGTWSPATISNTTSGSYVFTPNATECATTQTLSVVVNPLIQPNFTDLSICSGNAVPILKNISPNGITGTWVPSVINNTISGAYVFTPNPNQCATSKTINVTVNQSTLVNVDWTVTEAFSKNQIVTINATAAGDYLYQLDDGPFQESPIFEYVSLGTHSITVQDKNGCSPPITRNNVLVIDYPKFFTPNNDNYNDTWNIFSLTDQSNSKILIFDRYGKLLKELRPNGLGWDGTYIGQPMPANDYWFTVEYTEQDILKKFKSHFSLKR
ncbi:T9SS type B sorting domain-containing protein [Flavobacterium sp. AED]|uniref:T9SS type B sorting domain-containing protein n=1 Tax=Flavobacterium sp. AED TaxID=1423323 RepID=UPI00068F3051|nr:T9SS type B sorting domain-containing protein [Flavobacterium sp. AED]